MPIDDSALRHALFTQFADAWTTRFFKRPLWVLFFPRSLAPEIRQSLCIPLSDRAFALDSLGFTDVVQAFGAMLSGRSSVLITPLSTLCDWAPFAFSRGFFNPSLNFKWIGISDGLESRSLVSLSLLSVTTCRVVQPLSVATALNLLFEHHGPALVELPVPFVRTL